MIRSSQTLLQPELRELQEMCEKMLTVNPAHRMSARALLGLPFFKNDPKPCDPSEVLAGINLQQQTNEYFAREKAKARFEKRA
jgi:hypothetical protein